jgi:hypothetical protein
METGETMKLPVAVKPVFDISGGSGRVARSTGERQLQSW